MTRFCPDTSLGQKEKPLGDQKCSLLPYHWFSFWPRDVSGRNRAISSFSGFPFSPETSVEQNPSKIQNFAILKKIFFQKLSKICVFPHFLLQRRLWAKGKPKNSRSCSFCSRDVCGQKEKRQNRRKIMISRKSAQALILATRKSDLAAKS